MTEKSLQRLCKLWQKRLNLVDWDIKVSFVESLEDDQKFLVYGQCHWDSDIRVARVEISKKSDGIPYEETLIHELCHIVVQGHEAEITEHDVNIERAMNVLSKAFYNAYRRKKNGDTSKKGNSKSIKAFKTATIRT